MPNRVLITSKEVAEFLLTTTHPSLALRHVISIGSPVRDSPPAGFHEFKGHKLRMEFDDIEKQRVAAGYEGPSSYDALHVVRFAEECKADPEGVVLIHCAQGKSRSTASAIVFLATQFGPGYERESILAFRSAVEITYHLGLREREDQVHPNRRMVWLGDTTLGRNGALLNACLDTLGVSVYGIDMWTPE